MNEREVAIEIRRDVQRAAAGRGRVLYLEGKSDVPILLALLGAEATGDAAEGVLHEGVLIRGLRDGGGSGSKAVAQRLTVAQHLAYRGIFGVLDGDGATLEALAPEFDGPHRGPLFRWKTYCIENLLARAGWPAVWGPAPDEREMLAAFAPYVALNRLGLELRARLRTLQLHRFIQPTHAKLYTAEELLVRLREGKHKLAEIDVERMLSTELEHFQATLAQGLDEAHALVNGKWLVTTYAPLRTGLPADACRDGWTAHVRGVGGAPEVREWWRRAIAPA